MSGKRPAPAERRPQHAVDLFEKAVRALGKKDFERCREHLDALIAGHPGERDLLERARSYRTLCDRALERKAAFRPRSLQDYLAHGVFLHNRGEFAEAQKAFRQALELQPRSEDAHYCLAAACARAGDAAGAMAALRSAIALSPAVRAQVRADEDFDALREDEAFLTLLAPAP